MFTLYLGYDLIFNVQEQDSREWFTRSHGSKDLYGLCGFGYKIRAAESRLYVLSF